MFPRDQSPWVPIGLGAYAILVCTIIIVGAMVLFEEKDSKWSIVFPTFEKPQVQVLCLEPCVACQKTLEQLCQTWPGSLCDR
jgi:hypothetical protein